MSLFKNTSSESVCVIAFTVANETAKAIFSGSEFSRSVATEPLKMTIFARKKKSLFQNQQYVLPEHTSIYSRWNVKWIMERQVAHPISLLFMNRNG